jgi:hypothetical protein
MTPHAYWEDTCMKAPKWAFLGGGFIPSGLDEDNLIVTVVAPLAVGKHNGTCATLNR